MPQCPRCWYQLLTIISMIKAIIARLIFAIHSFIAVWRLTDVKNNPVYWCLSLTLLLLLSECVFTLWKKKGAEWKWFSPVVLFYLASVVPPIWFLELDLLFKRLEQSRLVSIGLGLNNTENAAEALSMIKGFGGVYIPIMMTADEWAKILEQFLLLFLIVGRWLLPKGDITRDQLSQLLLVNIGMAADIIELFEAFREDQVKYNFTLTVVILSLWTGSLLQFTLVVTATKARKPRVAISQPKKEPVGTCFCCETEIWAILTSILLQDGPFLVLRMMLIFRFEVVSYMNVFFTCKNTLVMLLQLYRIMVVIMERYKSKNHDEFSDAETISLSMSRSHSGLSRLSQFKSGKLPKSRSLGGLAHGKNHQNNVHSSYPYLNSKSHGDLTITDENYYPRPVLKPKYRKTERLSSKNLNKDKKVDDTSKNEDVHDRMITVVDADREINHGNSDQLPLATNEELPSLPIGDSVV